VPPAAEHEQLGPFGLLHQHLRGSSGQYPRTDLDLGVGAVVHISVIASASTLFASS